MISELNSSLQSLDISTKDVVPLVGTILGVFLGAYLAFMNEGRNQKNRDKEKEKDLLIRIYRQNSINLQTLLTYKNSFFLNFHYGFGALECFLKLYIDAPHTSKAVLRQEWHYIYRSLTKISSKHAGDNAQGIYRERWEKPDLLSFDIQEVSSIAKKSPDILGVTMYLSSTITLLKEELNIRDSYADQISKYAGNISAIYFLQDDFAKDLFKLFSCRHHAYECLERAISLSFGLSALLERHYQDVFGKIDFPFPIYSEDILNKITGLEESKNFFGQEKNFFLIKTRYDRAMNAAKGHKELNLKTSIMHSKF